MSPGADVREGDLIGRLHDFSDHSSAPLEVRAHKTGVIIAMFFAAVCEALGIPRDRRSLTEQNLQPVLDMVPRQLRYYLQAITRDTAVPTGLRAGQKINVIPGEAEAWIDGRYLPGQTPEGFLAEVGQVIGTGYGIERVDLSTAIEDEPAGPLYEAILSAMRRHAPGAIVSPIMLSGATDAKHITRLGTKCLGFGPVRIAEDFPVENLVHGHDERIPVDGYVWGLQVLYDIVVAVSS